MIYFGSEYYLVGHSDQAKVKKLQISCVHKGATENRILPQIRTRKDYFRSGFNKKRVGPDLHHWYIVHPTVDFENFVVSTVENLLK
jgi:hypothetical protein